MNNKCAAEEKYQARVYEWMQQCFEPDVIDDTVERNYRFMEEALELCQSLGATKQDAYRLADYVFGRPIGEPAQEVGGVMVTLAALCNTAGLDIIECSEDELKSVWNNIEKIRAKQAAKPKGVKSPLPGQYTPLDGLQRMPERKGYCQACSHERFGVKTRLAIEHTCGK